MLCWRRRMSLVVAGRRAVASEAAAAAEGGGGVNPKDDPAVKFFKEFVVSQIDYHTLLLEEANKKHNVPLNVPPQMNPPTDDHRPVYTDALGGRMQEPERHFCYAPLYGPPPRLPEMEPVVEQRAAPIAPQTKAEKKKAAGDAATPSGSAKPYKCSVCGKRFRVITAAQQHLAGHADDSTAEIIDESAQTAKATASSSDAAAPEAADKPAAPSALSKGPNPLKELMANMTTLSNDAAVALDIPSEPPVIYALPADSDIDALLLNTWDEVAAKVHGKAFKPCASFIISDTDSEVAQKMAAAGENHFGAAAGKAATDPSAGSAATPAGATGTANPLASAAARASLSTGGFSSPFVNANNYSAPMPTTHTAAMTERKFKCDACPKAFRLLDAAVNHYLIAHDDEPPEALLAEWKSLDNPHVKSLKTAAENAKKDSAAAEAAAAAAGDGEAEPAAAAPIEARAPLPEVQLSAHARVASNMVIAGQVLELRFGYIKAEPVAQLLIQVDEQTTTRRPRKADNTEAGSGAEVSSEGGDAAPDARREEADQLVDVVTSTETEYFTVRCYGEQFTDLLKPSLEAGATVLVHGTLLLNFHMEPETGEAFPYPFVKVVPPYGSITPIAPAPCAAK